MQLPIKEKLEIMRPANDISPKAAGAAQGGAIGLPLAVVVVYIINAIIRAFGGEDLPVEVSTAVGSLVTTLTAWAGAYVKAETLPEDGLAFDGNGDVKPETLDPGEQLEDYGV